MGRFAKLLLRLPGENILFFPDHFFLGPVRTNILIHHFCLTSRKSWDCNLRRSYGSAAQLSILKIPLWWTKLYQTLTQNSLPSFLLPNTACLTSWKSSCYIFLLAALRSIGLRCMEHLFFLRIVGEVSITSYSLISCSNKIYLFLYLHFLSKELYFSGEHQRHWLTSLWLVGGRPGLNWDLWQKWSNKVPAPWILRDQKTDTFLKIFNHLVFEPTPAMNSIVYVERV